MIWPQVIAIVGILIFAIILIQLFLIPFLVVILNALLVFFIAVRMFAHLRNGRRKDYAIAGVSSALILLIFGNPLTILWPLTTFLVLTLAIEQLIRFARKR